MCNAICSPPTCGCSYSLHHYELFWYLFWIWPFGPCKGRFCTVEAEGGPERNEYCKSQSSILKRIGGKIIVSRGGSEQPGQHGAVPRGRGAKARLQRISGKRTRIQVTGFKPWEFGSLMMKGRINYSVVFLGSWRQKMSLVGSWISQW